MSKSEFESDAASKKREATAAREAKREDQVEQALASAMQQHGYTGEETSKAVDGTKGQPVDLYTLSKEVKFFEGAGYKQTD